MKSAEAAVESSNCFADNLGWLLSQASFALASEIGAAFAPLGVSSRGFHVLAAAMTEDHTQRELTEIVGLDKTTMVVTIDELEEAGLAERRPSETDRRARVIAVTKAGERKVAECRKVVEQIQADVLDSLPAGQRQGLLEGLATLVKHRLAEAVDCNPPLRRREPRG